MLPNLNGLKAFEAAGRSLNFRAAADKLAVTQGAVAQQVRALESQLGVNLFVRKSRGLAFTAAGRAFHARIVDAFETIRQASSSLRPEQDKVTISVTPTFAAKWLIPNLGDFNASHPDIDLRILATEAMSSFRADGIDLAVRQGSKTLNASLESRLLFENEIVAVASPQRAGTNTQPLSSDAIAGMPKLHDGHNLWPAFLAQLRVKDRSGRGIRLNQTALAIDAAIGGQGAALASRFLVERDIEAGRLVQLTEAQLTNSSAFHLIARKGQHRTKAVERVMHWLQSRAQPDGGN